MLTLFLSREFNWFWNNSGKIPKSTVYILQLCHCESACAHFILLYHNLKIFNVYTVD